jgi:cytochrome c551
MRILKLLAVVIALALVIIGCNNASDTNQPANTTANAPNANANTARTGPTPADEMTSARALYAAECARCHGINGEGGTATVLKKKLKVPSLKTGHALDHTEDQLAKQIRDGGDGMPAFGDRLKPEEITGQVKLIRQEFQKGAAKK